MTCTLETAILALLEPGGLLTADTIAHNLDAPRWRVSRVLHRLRRNGDAFQNRRAQWQISAEQRRPQRQATR
jgi:DNA-binding IclR family transcriptional regulator